jgi:hypothetical protein
MNEHNYLVQFNMINEDYDGVAIIPVITKVYTCVPYWNDITQEQREEEVKSFAISQLEEVGVLIDETRLENVEITEFYEEDQENENCMGQ